MLSTRCIQAAVPLSQDQRWFHKRIGVSTLDHGGIPCWGLNWSQSSKWRPSGRTFDFASTFCTMPVGLGLGMRSIHCLAASKKTALWCAELNQTWSAASAVDRLR